MTEEKLTLLQQSQQVVKLDIDVSKISILGIVSQQVVKLDIDVSI